MRSEQSLVEKYALVNGLLQNYFLPVFTPVKRGRRPKAVSRTISNFEGTKMLEVAMFEQLDAADQDLFLAILSFCGDGEATPADELLEADGHIRGMESIRVETTAYALLKRMNRAVNGRARTWLAKSLDRLAKTSLKFDGQRATWRVNLLNYSYVKNECGEVEGLRVWVNPIAALVFTGGANTGYVKHSLTDRLSLKSEIARILHSYIVGMVRVGCSRVFEVDTLVSQVYATPAPSERAARKRRTEIRKAAEQLARLRGWHVEINRSKVLVKRHFNAR